MRITKIDINYAGYIVMLIIAIVSFICGYYVGKKEKNSNQIHTIYKIG